MKMIVKKTLSITFFLAIAATFFPAVATAGILDSFFGDFLGRYRQRERPNIAEYVIQQNERRGKFDTLIAALSAVSADPELPDLIGTLSNDGPFTVFAPTDNAFAELGLSPENVGSALPLPDLTDILLYHVTAGSKKAIPLLFERDIDMLNGDEAEFNLSFRPFGFFINDAKIIDANNLASNGIVHVIDGVLIPPTDAPPASLAASLSVAAVPEPTSIGLVGATLFSAVLISTRRKRPSQIVHRS